MRGKNVTLRVSIPHLEEERMFITNALPTSTKMWMCDESLVFLLTCLLPKPIGMSSVEVVVL